LTELSMATPAAQPQRRTVSPFTTSVAGGMTPAVPDFFSDYPQTLQAAFLLPDCGAAVVKLPIHR
jgi:hypothetical protein